MKVKMSYEQRIFYSATAFGGYLGGYALLSRCNVLGSAQTANMAELLLDILGRDVADGFIRAGALFVYVFALILTVALKIKTKFDIRIISIVINFVGIIVLFFIPSGVDNVLALYPVFFVLAFQWNSFTGAKGYSSSCIFSTNNLRQTVCSFTDYALTQNIVSLQKGRFFAGSLFYYHLGVAVSFFGDVYLKLYSVIFAAVPLIAAVFFIYLESRQKKNINVK